MTVKPVFYYIHIQYMYTMDSVLQNLSKVLNRDTKLEVYNVHTQESTEDPKTVLWNESLANIDKNTLAKFKEFIESRSCKFYKAQATLPYFEFCLAIVVTVRYTFNVKNATQIGDKSFKSAWRLLTIAKDINLDEGVSEWIKERLCRRTVGGYANYIANSEQVPNVSYRRTTMTGNYSHTRVISLACMSNNIVDISALSSNSSANILDVYAKTPECHLDMLRIYGFDNIPNTRNSSS